jgi:two-component system OmpR family response regulator
MSRTWQVLIVDDDEEITHLLSNYLSRFGYVVFAAQDGESMRRQLSAHAIDLLVMDVMLPGTDGLALAREVRQTSLLPIIMLTARSDPYDRVIGLENGADDYVSKPFEPRELVARIQTVLRRSMAFNDGATDPVKSEVVCFDRWELHREQRNLHSPDGLVIPLSNAEFRLLCTFLRRPRRLFSRDQLTEQARGRTIEVFDRSIDLLVSRLRQKLAGEANLDSMIKTVRGAGYMFNVQSVHGRASWQN